MFRMGCAGVALMSVVVLAGSVTAQDADDWDYGEDPSRDTAVAAVTFDSFGVAVRCMNDNLSVLVSGLPSGTGERSLSMALGDQPARDTTWVSARDSGTLFALWPRAMAEKFREGGRLSLVVPDQGRSRRYAFDLPRSDQSIARVFQACGKPLEGKTDPAPDQVDLSGLSWVRMPEISFPSRADFEGGLAAIYCEVRPDGRLRDCSVESEFPDGSGFGRASTYGAHRTGRVEASGEGDKTLEGRRISFVTRFGTAPVSLPPTATRLPDNDSD